MNRTIKYFRQFLFFLLVFSLSCSEERETNTPPVADFQIYEDLDEIILSDNSIDEDGDMLSCLWSANSEKVAFSNTNLPETSFIIPSLTSPLNVEVELKVSDSEDETVVHKSIVLPVLNEARLFGLGRELGKEADNDAKNEWYLDQANTGPHSALNCGPTSVTMAIKWVDSLFSGTPADARQMFRSAGGWWYTGDIIGYLNHYSVNNYVIALSGMNDLVMELDKGNIAILCLDMYYLRYEIKGRWHVDKFYRTDGSGWGHFLVVKGYKMVDGKLLLEAYDPYCFGKTYSDGSPKGKNRYYRGEDIDISTGIWWDYAIIVTLRAGKGSGALDPASVPQQYGGNGDRTLP